MLRRPAEGQVLLEVGRQQEWNKKGCLQKGKQKTLRVEGKNSPYRKNKLMEYQITMMEKNSP